MKQVTAIIALVLLTHLSASAAVIYFDDFSGGGGALNGTTPDTTPGGEIWSSSALWNDDGTKSSAGTAAAFLPFSPVAGNVYALSVTMNPDAIVNNDWFALGFTSGSNTAAWHAGGGSNLPAAWILNRQDDASSSTFQTFLGPNTNSGLGTDFSPDRVGPLNVEIVLDARFANWSVAWYADGDLIRNTLNTFTTNPTINQVAIGGWVSATGTIDNFQLRTVQRALPEPTTIAMLGLGVGIIGAMRKRKRQA